MTGTLVTVVRVKTATPDPTGDVLAYAVCPEGRGFEWRCTDAYIGERYRVTIEAAA